MNNIRFKNKYRVPSSRLKNWDYSSDGWYYVTICAKNRICRLGEISNRKMQLSSFGKIVEKYWLEIPVNFRGLKLGEFKIMPNHMHGIVVIKSNVETVHEPSLQSRKRSLLSKIIGRFKMQASKEINILKKMPNKPFWQPRFYDHIIRDEKSLLRIRDYIRNNHLNWDTDEENPKNIKKV